MRRAPAASFVIHPIRTLIILSSLQESALRKDQTQCIPRIVIKILHVNRYRFLKRRIFIKVFLPQKKTIALILIESNHYEIGLEKMPIIPLSIGSLIKFIDLASSICHVAKINKELDNTV